MSTRARTITALAVAAGLTVGLTYAAGASSAPVCSGTYYATDAHHFEAVVHGADGGFLTWDVRTTLPGADAHVVATYIKAGDQVQDVPHAASVVRSIRVSPNLGLAWCTLAHVASAP